MFKHFLKHGNLPICVYTLAITIQVFTVLLYAWRIVMSQTLFMRMFIPIAKQVISQCCFVMINCGTAM